MENITIIQWCLAFSGMLIHTLQAIAVAQTDKKFKLLSYIKEKWVHLLTTLIMLPVILITITDTSLVEILPINNLTALLAGFQTDSFFGALVEMGRNKYLKKGDKDA